MKAVRRVTGRAAPLQRADIDTDTIIPQRWLITTERTGLGRGLFSNWRYLSDGETPDPAFILNRPSHAGAEILVAGPNYGCGSSREHAVWAHLDYGINAVISSSFGPIFRDNALKNGLFAIELDMAIVDQLQQQLDSAARVMTIDLIGCQLIDATGKTHGFSIDEERRQALIDGQDDIAATLKHDDAIRAFQSADRRLNPWIWDSVPSER